MHSYSEALNWAKALIGKQDARLLLEFVANVSHAQIVANPDKLLNDEVLQCYQALVCRRQSDEPLAYLLESAYFMGRLFKVSPAVLIPRPDTEVLVQCAINYLCNECSLEDGAPKVLDLGTGSGIVAISIAQAYPKAKIFALDVSEAALCIAKENASSLGASNIEWLISDWFSGVPKGEKFDVIVSNPPYIADNDPHLKGDGLPFEPLLALSDQTAGTAGMACIQTIVENSAPYLVSNGRIFIEHGYDQAVKVRDLLDQNSFSHIQSWKDAAGIERVSGGAIK